MRHFRPEPGQPTPVDEVNAELLKAKLLAPPLAIRARQGLERGGNLGPDATDVVIADMVELLDEGRIERGFADVQDLSRAGYHPDLAWSLGTRAAKALAERVAERGEADAEVEPEAA